MRALSASRAFYEKELRAPDDVSFYSEKDSEEKEA